LRKSRPDKCCSATDDDDNSELKDAVFVRHSRQIQHLYKMQVIKMNLKCASMWWSYPYHCSFQSSGFFKSGPNRESCVCFVYRFFTITVHIHFDVHVLNTDLRYRRSREDMDVEQPTICIRKTQ
jgi:hypothetical protein